jgi:hypothetical protein
MLSELDTIFMYALWTTELFLEDNLEGKASFFANEMYNTVVWGLFGVP